MRLYHWFALPTWLLARFALLFVTKKHPWYGRRFTLLDWYQGRRPFAIILDYVLWFHIMWITLLTTVHYARTLWLS